MDWIEALAECEAAGTAAVLVTVLDARGSSPREAGAKFVVTMTGQRGSVGGGTLEHRCAEMARALLADGVMAPSTRDFPLGPALGQCCGGQVRMLFEPLFVRAWNVVLFGAGHVGHAVARLLADLPCRVRWVDARADTFPDPLPGRSVVRDTEPRPESVVAAISPDASVLVMTHDHALDYRVVSACLARDDLRFVGLIGSATKAARFRSRLSRDGLPAGSVARLCCPIGILGIGGKLPAEIAISAVAQLLQVRDRGANVSRDDVLVLHPANACDGCAMART